MVTYYNRKDLIDFANFCLNSKAKPEETLETKADEFDFINQVEKFLEDFDNLGDTGFFKNKPISQFVSKEYQEMNLYEFMHVGRDLIRMLLVRHKNKNRSDISESVKTHAAQSDIKSWLASTNS